MAENIENSEGTEKPESTDQGGQPSKTEQAETAQQEPAGTQISKDARMWAMFCHLAGLAGYVVWFIGNIITPLIVWQVKKDEFAFVDEQGKEAVNFQISMSIYALVSTALIPLFCVGAFLLTAVVVADLVLLIIAAIKTNNGQHYRYPLTIRFIK